MPVVSASGSVETLVRKPLSSAQLLALTTAGLQLVAAPGANRYIRPLGVELSVTPGGTPYSTCDLFVSTAAMYADVNNDAWFSTKGIHALDSATPTVAVFGTLGAAGTDQIANTAILNQPLVLIGDPAPTLGNGTAVLSLSYYIATV